MEVEPRQGLGARFTYRSRARPVEDVGRIVLNGLDPIAHLLLERVVSMGLVGLGLGRPDRFPGQGRQECRGGQAATSAVASLTSGRSLLSYHGLHAAHLLHGAHHGGRICGRPGHQAHGHGGHECRPEGRDQLVDCTLEGRGEVPDEGGDGSRHQPGKDARRGGPPPEERQDRGGPERRAEAGPGEEDEPEDQLVGHPAQGQRGGDQRDDHPVGCRSPRPGAGAARRRKTFSWTSRTTVDAATRSWESAVDMMAAKMAATTIPKSGAGRCCWARTGKRFSGSAWAARPRPSTTPAPPAR
jgi:hypothetical protein